MAKSSDESVCLQILIDKYKVYDKDFMGYDIDSANNLTYHHIIPRSKGGLTTLDNGAVLLLKSHAYLHEMERKNYITFRQINRLFQTLIETQMPPDLDYFLKINYLIEKYENRKSRVRKK